MRMKLVWMAGVLAAVLPASAQQYVTQPDTTSYAVVTRIIFSPDEQSQSATLSAKAIDPTRSAGCPVAMRAQRLGMGATVQVRDGEKPVLGQRIHLEIERGEYSALEAKVTVHGTRGRARLFSALSTNDVNQGADAARSFTLKPGNEAAGDIAKTIASDLTLAGFTSVLSISLDSITYADGSQWKMAAGHSCIVTPDPLMLVSQR